MAPQKQSAEHWLCKQVQDAVEDCLRVWWYYVATLADTPGDWIEEPEERGERAAVLHETG